MKENGFFSSGVEGKMGFGKFEGSPKPVKVGDEVDVTIEAIAAKGDGIAKID